MSKKDFFIKAKVQIMDAFAILRLNRTKMAEVSARPSAVKWGIMFLAVPPIVNLLLSTAVFSSGFGVIFSRFLFWPVIVPILAIVGCVFLMSIVAEKGFKGCGDHVGFFKVLSYSGIILWALIVPFLLAVLGMLDVFGLFNLVLVVSVFWMFAVSYHMLIIHHKLKSQDAIAVIVIGVIGYFILRGVLGSIFVGRMYRMWY